MVFSLECLKYPDLFLDYTTYEQKLGILMLRRIKNVTGIMTLYKLFLIEYGQISSYPLLRAVYIDSDKITWNQIDHNKMVCYIYHLNFTGMAFVGIEFQENDGGDIALVS